MRIRIFIPFLIFFGFGCFSNPNIEDNYKLTAINYIMDDRLIYNNGDIDTNQHNFKIIFYKDITLYEVPEIQLKMFNSAKKNGVIINKVMPLDTSYSYYLIKNGYKKGLKFTDINAKNGNSFSGDSLLRALNIHPSLLGIYSVELGKPSEVKKERNREIEKYFSKEIDSDPDSIYRYYDASLVNIPFTFSPLLDKRKNSKLFKTFFLYAADKKNKRSQRPRIEGITAFEKIALIDSNTFINIFKTFEKTQLP